MLWILAVLAACTGAVDTEATDTEADVCADSLAAGEVEVFAEGFEVDGTAGTEGIAFSPDGRLFVGGSSVTGGGFVAEVQPDGSWETLADVPGSIGLTWWNDTLVVATTDAGEGSGGIVTVADDGTVTFVADGIPGSNFPVVAPWGNLLVSTPGEDLIFEVTAAGEVSTWLADVPSPNGLAFSPAEDVVYVANTYTDPNDVGVVTLDGTAAGDYAVLATLETGSTQDGVAMDDQGDLYIALNLPGEVVRVTPEGDVTVVADGVDWAASIAFGEGEGFDPCSIYATSLFSDVVYRVGVGRPGR